jgi:FAD/FMN-containing dehydrogenase
VALPARDTSTCQAIANLGVNVWFDPPNTTTSEYDLEQEHYWSTVCSAIRPACIITPSTTDEVSTIVTTLRDNHSRFAIKGAGHNPNQGWASIADAPVISTRNFNHVIYDNKTNTVRVGSGNRWVNVIEALESLGLTVSGGRVGDVGVGGYLLGGK